MDPIFDRLGRLIRSNNPFSSSSTDDMDDEQRAAFDELEAELNAPKGAPKRPATLGGRTFQEQRRQESTRREPPPPPRPSLDPALVQAYGVLGVPATASWEEINVAHRALLKKHHPDRHAGNETLVKQATAQSQKINEAYQILKKHLGR
jgi:DnaJ-domain-containing protein 1